MNSKQKALIWLPGPDGLPSLGEAGVSRLEREAPAFAWKRVADKDGFLAELPGAVVALTWRFRRDWLASAPDLRLVSTPAAGREWLEIRSGPGLTVWFGGFHGIFMAETVAGLILAFVRGIKASIDCAARGEAWPRKNVHSLMRPLRGARVVILGFGRVGKWIGRLLKPFGVGLAGVNRSDFSRPSYFDAGDAVHPLERLDDLLPTADHLVLALPNDAGSDRIMDARRLALLPRNAYIYNIGRGNAIDQPALVASLESGALAGAGLDVFELEPLPADDPILRAPNLIALPHVSAFAPGYMDAYLDEFLERLRREGGSALGEAQP
ncbi:MAG: hydroxyacid dehydrogenase [Planctomycetota bacterium]|jgi:phosphoglycerate dehydrogenase-like enzyme|nr:hydroxyacid dehydrogenase [Planctomycetota bacterium]